MQFHCKVLNASHVDALREHCDALSSSWLPHQLSTVLGCVIEPTSSSLLNGASLNCSLPCISNYKTNADSYHSLKLEISKKLNQNIQQSDALKSAVELLSLYVKQLFPINKRNCYLFSEQYIVKSPRSICIDDGTAFDWHFDSQYMPIDCQMTPTVSCWVALDDMMPENGTLIIQGYENQLNSKINQNPHGVEEFNNLHFTRDRKCGIDSRAEIIVIPTGSVVFMSGYVWHCSPPNRTEKNRRAWMPQFSLEPLFHDGELLSLAVPM
ncbi:hypothetical protein HK096_004327 [Nowakowskiella sp. JEL0078]|nr:hypothetical protein HK096_004327 [Nowakowskiella sp. JEL0078]